ncbi:uncharacterized protein METZ01_LOCUS432831 [marine metagenome]|uniref:Uncharacterized protein n=1 Tax=marine metagenome TaxID=408172 RepID=A0A382Y9G2_9ZZZZ
MSDTYSYMYRETTAIVVLQFSIIMGRNI